MLDAKQSFFIQIFLIFTVIKFYRLFFISCCQTQFLNGPFAGNGHVVQIRQAGGKVSSWGIEGNIRSYEKWTLNCLK